MKIGNKIILLIVIISLLLLSIQIYRIYTYPFTDGDTTIANAGEDKTAKVNETVVFNASLSFIHGVSIEAMKVKNFLVIWDFDDRDGIQVNAVGITVNHTYNKTGVYIVTLIIVTYPVPDKPRYAIYEPNVVVSDTVQITVIE